MKEEVVTVPNGGVCLIVTGCKFVEGRKVCPQGKVYAYGGNVVADKGVHAAVASQKPQSVK